MEPTNTSSRNMIIGIVVVILIIIVGTFFLAKSPAQPNTDTTASPTEVAQGGDRVAVSPQFPGNTLYLDSVTLANGGWVAVHESNAGAPGKVIGSKYFAAGTNPGSIDLSSSMVSGKEYIVMLHADNGDMKFDESIDPPLRDSYGNIIMTTIKASKTPEQVKG